MWFRQVQKLKNVAILQCIGYICMGFLYRLRELVVSKHGAFKKACGNLPVQFSYAIIFFNAYLNVKLPFFIRFASGENSAVMCPAQLYQNSISDVLRLKLCPRRGDNFILLIINMLCLLPQ